MAENVYPGVVETILELLSESEGRRPAYEAFSATERQ